MMKHQRLIGLCIAGWAAVAACAAEPPVPGWSVVGSDRMDIAFLQNGALRFMLKNRIIGPGWKGGLRPKNLAAVSDGNRRVYEEKGLAFYARWFDKTPLEGSFDVGYRLEQTGPRAFSVIYRVTPELAVKFGSPGKPDEKSITIGPVLEKAPFFENGSCVLTMADGKTQQRPLPVPQGGYGDVAAVALKSETGETVRMTFEPPLYIHCDAGELRCFSGNNTVKQAGKTFEQRIGIELPAAAAFEPANRMVDLSDWFELDVDQANSLEGESFTDMRDWQTEPAGQRGWLRMEGDHFVWEKTGERTQLWGLNPLKPDGSVDREYLAQSAEQMARLGMNLCRFHAFAKPNRPKMWAHMLKIQDVEDGMQFDKTHMPLFDYGYAKMREHGIYHGWSVVYGWYPTPADKERLIAYDEAITQLRHGGSFYHLHGVMPDVQDLIIQFHVKLLNHVNPHTGLRYADDPALAFVELQNEDNIFLQMRNHEQHLKKMPTYRKLFYQRFADWLKQRYQTRDALAKAWGTELGADESLDKANIAVFPAWYQGRPTKRVADQMHFLYTTQRDYYQRFEKAVRETGYGGCLIGSCWQAADWVGHLYNTLSDRDIGFIDRHNYNRIDLRTPGVGLMSAGFQSVIDRPFSFSEWSGGSRLGQRLDVPQVAIYGMGLQGWDASMQFAWSEPGIIPFKSAGVNNSCNDFAVLSQYPALSRLVRRGDVDEGALVANRRVSLAALRETGDVGFTEAFSLLGGANNKSFFGAVPSAALAAGRVTMEFVDGAVEQAVIDNSAQYVDEAARVVRSSTGQLTWDYKGDGFNLVNTPGTKAVIGYARDQRHDLGDAAISVHNPFATVYLSACGKEESVAGAKHLLITAVARSIDKDTVFDEFSTRPISRNMPWEERYEWPLLIEPVSATIELRRTAPCRVYALDHGGRQCTPHVELGVEKIDEGCRFTLDGKKHGTMYYLVEVQ